jgi:serine protease Do
MEASMRGPVRLWLSVAVLVFVSDVVLSPYGAPQPPTSPSDGNLFRIIASQQNPVVVAIKTTTWLDPADAEDAEWFERFFGRAFPRGPQLHHEVASGFLISSDGDILTNDHVVADVDVIEVRLLGRETTTYRATVVGRDPMSDSAVIRLAGGPSQLPVATLGDSDSLETGDWVMAIGNPFQLGHSVTVGVVSYVGRSFEISEGRWQKLIQTDASINPGSSGGPLLNTRGEVVGISLALLADGFGDNMGIGFAVPINSVKAVLADLRAGRVVRGHIGVRLRQSLITDNDAAALGLPAARGALITSVDEASSAAAAGFRPGDVIVEFLGIPIATADDLLTRVATARPGSHARAIVIRDGRTRAIDVDVEVLPLPTSPRRRLRAEGARNLGLTLGDVPRSARGPADGSRVERVEDGSVAANAGIEPGDIVRKVNRRTVHTAAEAVLELQRTPIGGTVFLLIWRDGHEQLVEMGTE